MRLEPNIETPIRYHAGDLIKFSYIPPSPSLSDLENENKGNATWNIHRGIVEERLIKGNVIWVAPHPNKENHFLIGLKYSTKKNRHRRIIFRIILVIVVALGALIVTTNRYVVYDRVNSLFEWCSSLYYTMLNDLFYWLPLWRRLYIIKIKFNNWQISLNIYCNQEGIFFTNIYVSISLKGKFGTKKGTSLNIF